MAESFLGLSDDDGAGEAAMADAQHEAARAQAAEIADAIEKQPPLAGGVLDSVRARVKARQDEVGYDGDYAAWVARFSG